MKRPTAVAPRGLRLSLFVPLCALLPLQAARAQQTAPIPPPPETGSITGVVTAVETGTLLANARVALVGADFGATVGADGRYTIALVPPGTYRLRAQLIGYTVAERGEVVVTAGQATTSSPRSEIGRAHV